MRGLIQIAGINDKAEAEMLVECGVNYLGFPLRLTAHEEDISEDDAANIMRSLPPPTCGVLITYLEDPDEIRALCHRLGARIVQLHGEVPLESLGRLRSVGPGLRIIKSLIVREDNLAELKWKVREASLYVDAFITDTFDPTTGACGATGKTHDWSITRELVEISRRPVILAGGLNPDNVREAISEVRPAGVDAHTGVEGKDGRKNRNVVEAFLSEAREAFAALGGE